MRIITKKEQEEIDKLMVNKLEFAMKNIFFEFKDGYSGELTDEQILSNIKINAENIYYADNVMFIPVKK